MRMKMNKEYLGDGVYVELENGMLKLSTYRSEHGGDDIIFLEYEVYLSLLQYVKRLEEKFKT